MEPYKVLMFEGIINFFSLSGYYFLVGRTKNFKIVKEIFSSKNLNITAFFVLIFFILFLLVLGIYIECLLLNIIHLWQGL